MISLWATFTILGPEARGIMIVTLTWVRLACGIAHLSFGQSILHHAGKIEKSSFLPITFGSALTVCATMTIFVWLALGGASFIAHKEVYGETIPQLFFFFTLILVPFIIWDFYGLSLLTAINQLKISNKAGFLSQTVSLCLLPLLFIFNIFGGIMATLAGQVINAVYGLVYIKNNLSEQIKFCQNHTKNLLSNALKMHPAVLCGIIVSYSDVLMISHFLGTTQAGFYQMAVQLVFAMLMLPQTATMVIFTLTSKDGVKKSWPDCRNIILLVSMLMVIACVCAWYLAPLVLPAIFGQESIVVVPIFTGLLFAVIGQSLAALVSPQWIVNGYFKTISMISVVMTIGNLVLNYLLIPIYGVNGAIIATCFIYISSIFINGGMVIVMERRWRKSTIS